MSYFNGRFFALAAALLAGAIPPAMAAPRDALIGAWCFYEQASGEQKVAEKVDITFQSDGSYLWQEGGFKQMGTWTLSDTVLEMTKVGKHAVVHIGASAMELKRGSTMRFKKEKCSASAFGDQDIIQFQNAASTGDLGTIESFIAKKIDINVIDFSRGDTALIKAAKFCQVPAAQLLLAKGAERRVKNEDEKTALDYAKTSSFHKGCDALVKLLQ